MTTPVPKNDPRFINYAASFSMGGAFKYFTHTEKNGVALTTDAGYGKTAINLANHFEQVICLCEDEGSATAINLRLAEKNIGNVQVQVGSIDHLPFTEQKFACIALHSVPFTKASKPKKLLSQCQQLISKKGDIYLSYHFSGRAYWSKIRILINANGCGLKLRGRIYHYPSINYVNFVRLISYQTMLGIENILFELKRFIDGYNIGFVGYKHKETATLIDQIWATAETALGKTLSKGYQVSIGSHNSVITDLGQIIVRLPQSPTAVALCHNNFENLNSLIQYDLPFETPKALLQTQVGTQQIFIESKIGGTSLDTIIPHEDFEFYRKMGAEFLLHPNMPMQEASLSEAIRIHVLTDSNELKQFLTEPQKVLFQQTLDQIMTIGINIKVPMTMQHGDYKYSNFLGSTGPNKRITGIIDWNMGTIPGLPLTDIITISYYGYETVSWEYAQYILTLTQNKPPNELIKRYCKHFDIGEDLLNLLCFLIAIRYLNRYFPPHVKSQQDWQQMLITDSLLPVCKDLYGRFK